MSNQNYVNALINETSPYLLQHAHNPVQWHPWGKEALNLAKELDKPILLSIGYSACHWCHVMAHESFENEETAALMNDNFVNIKVDREERPDIDSIYMAVVQLVTGNGGWPMTVFLTPDQVPIFCGTYFPPSSRYGVPSFTQILIGVSKAYREKKDSIQSDGKAIIAELGKPRFAGVSSSEINLGMLGLAADAMCENYDPENGGFGNAPKFPPAMTLNFLMRSWVRDRNARYLEIASCTLDRMARGGMYDQLGGGFHRYSVDAQWLVPHFEKMLYDNALLSRSYVDGYLATGNPGFKRIAVETLDYVAREMKSPEGGFYSSQDADSEGKEGVFFLWTPEQARAILGDEKGNLFCRHYGITQKGNFEGKNILRVPRPIELAAHSFGLSEERLSEIIEEGKRLLFQAREARIKPGRDEKILAAGNGLMLRSFAEAAATFDRDDYRKIAVENAEFLLSNLWRDGRLHRSFKDGRSRFNGYLDDYACLADGLISLYEACFDLRWIKEAEKILEAMISRFWDPQEKGFYFTANDHESLIHRPKEYMDNAVPSGNSAAAYALLRLSKLTGDDRWASYSEAVFVATGDLMRRIPAAFPNLLCALDFALSRSKEIAIVGDPDQQETKKLLQVVFGLYLPNKVVACGLDCGIALLESRSQMDGKPTAYVCENRTCKMPVTTAEALAEIIRS
jgi:uncharacterized protein YyaL (SSP411 family)